MSTPLPQPYLNISPLPELTSRFEESWIKVLPVQDRPVFSSELVETQDVIRYQQHKLFQTLYTSYSIVRGLEISIVSSNPIEHVLVLHSGQVYWSNQGLGYFIDIPEQVITVDASMVEVSIGLSIQRDIVEGPGDPMDGGDLYGSRGALREVLNATVVTQSNDAYPLAVYQPTDQILLYFRNNRFRATSDANPALLEEAFQQVLSEDMGSFVAEGLEVQMDSGTLSISSGRAYVQGTNVQVKQANYFQLANSSLLYLTLDRFGQLNLYPTFTQEVLVLGQVRQGQWYSNSVHLPSVTQLVNIEKLHERNQRELIELSIIKNQRLNNTGFLFDNFNSLEFSDINHPLYSATWAPSIPAMQAGVFAIPVRGSTLKLLSAEAVQRLEGVGQSTLLMPSNTTQVTLSQPLATYTISLLRSLSPELSLNPQVSQLQEIYKTQVDPTVPNEVLGSIFELGQLVSQTVTARAEGFEPFENNLRLEFGGVRVYNLQPLEGTLEGTQLDTLQAKADGSVEFSFEIPANLTYQPYLVRLGNDQLSAQTLYGQLNPVGGSIGQTSALAQSFVLQNPLVSYGVNLAIANWPFNSLLKVKLVQYQEGQFGFSLAEGTLRNAAISANGTVWSEVQWTKPVFLESGSYALLIEGIQNDIRLFAAKVGDRALNGGISITDQPLVSGELYIMELGKWRKELSSDLTFQLLKQIPTQLRSEAIFEVSNPQSFIDRLALDIQSVVPPNTQIQLEYFLNGQWRPINSSLVTFSGNLNTVQLKVIFTNVEDRLAWIDLDNTTVELQNNLFQTSWVSRTQTLEASYDHIEIKAITFRPSGSRIRAYISSNESQSWEEISLTNTDNVDETTPLDELTWAKELTSNVTYSDLSGTLYQRKRTKLTVRIDFENPEAFPGSPFIQNLRILAD
jgi:hypothetical protein